MSFRAARTSLSRIQSDTLVPVSSAACRINSSCSGVTRMYRGDECLRFVGDSLMDCSVLPSARRVKRIFLFPFVDICIAIGYTQHAGTGNNERAFLHLDRPRLPHLRRVDDWLGEGSERQPPAAL